MKKLKSFALILILFTGCVSTEKPKDQTVIGMFTPYSFFPETLNGKVKMVVEKSYLAKEVDGKLVADRPLTVGDRDSIGWTNDFIVRFDENGLVLKSEEIDENGKIIHSTVNHIENGKVIRTEDFRNDTLQMYQKNYYTPEGWYEKLEVYSDKDSLRSIFKIQTDSLGNITSAIIYNPMNEIKSRFEFHVGQDSKWHGYKSFDKEGNKTFEQKYFFNDHGFMERQILIDKAGDETESLYTYLYGDKGNWIEAYGSSGNNKLVTKREIEYYE